MKRRKKRLRFDRLLILIVIVIALIVALFFGGMKIFALVQTWRSSSSATDSTAALTVGRHAKDIAAIQSGHALDKVDTNGFSDEELRSCFFSSEIDDKLLERLKAMGYEGHESEIPADQLRYVRVLYRNYDGESIIGEIMVNEAIADDVEEVFYNLYTHNYQIGKMILLDAYGGSTAAAYADNVTTGLAFQMTETDEQSSHSQGYAIDLNPLYNPFVKDNGDTLTIFPVEGQLYIDRTVDQAHYIGKDDYAYQAFTDQGFTWGGDITGNNDYKHFEKKPANSTTKSSQSEEQTTQDAQNPGENGQQTDDASQEPIQGQDDSSAAQQSASDEEYADGEDQENTEADTQWTDPYSSDDQWTDGQWDSEGEEY